MEYPLQKILDLAGGEHPCLPVGGAILVIVWILVLGH
jgi:hypothetical protein